MRVAVAAACVGAIAAAGVSAADQAEAFQGTIPVDSIANNAPEDAEGPLRGSYLYTGSLSGGDTEDWLQFWRVPRWGAPMVFFSTCGTRAELYSTITDSLRPSGLVTHVDVGPAGARFSDHAADTVVRRNLVRIVRTDGGTEPCDWHMDSRGRYAAPPPPSTAKLRVQRKNGRAVAITLRAHLQPRRSARRPALIEISGAMRRTIRTQVPQVGIIVRRIALPAGRKGTVRVQISVPATELKAAVPLTSARVKISTPRPVVRRPAPKPRRPVVRRPKGPVTKVADSAFNVGIGARVRPGAIQAGESRCSFWLSNIRWSTWTSTSARGRALINQPQNGDTCPEMRKNRSITPATIRLTKPIYCDGVRLFSRLTWTMNGRSRSLDGGCPWRD